METAKVVLVIRTTHKKGNGTDTNPFREVERYWTLDGELLCEVENFKSGPANKVLTTDKIPISVFD